MCARFCGKPSELWQPPYGDSAFQSRRQCRLVQSSPFNASGSLETRVEAQVVHTTDSKHELPIAGNVLARQFDPAAPNKAYVSDITYIRTGAGWLCLEVVIHLFSRRVVGWAMAPSMPAKLVCEALHMALEQRCPAAGLVVHSDLAASTQEHSIKPCYPAMASSAA